MQDSGIIELFFAREEQALKESEKKYGRLLRQIANNILDNREDADEAVNIAYERIWNSIPPNRPQSFCGYICAVVRNTALNELDKLKRRSTDELDSELCEIIADSKTVESEFFSRMISEHINEFLSKTNAQARKIFVSRYYYNMSVRDIAHCAGMTESAVKTRLSRTRSQLRKFLLERGVDV